MNHQEHKVLETRKLSEHPRMLFFLSCIGFFIGIYYGSDGIDIPHDALAIIFPMILILFMDVKRFVPVMIILGMVLFGYSMSVWKYDSHISNIEHLSWSIGTKQYIVWTIDKRLYKTELNQAYRLSIDNFDNISTHTVDIAKSHIYLLVEIPENLSVQIGDTIGFTGKIQGLYKWPIDGFEKYVFFHELSGKVTLSNFSRITEKRIWALTHLTETLERKIFQWFPRDTAGIILGMTIGNVDLMGRDIQEEFRDSWISHILVVSGSNITFLIVLIGWLLKYLPLNRTLRIVIICSFVSIYSTLVWWDVPVIRSTIMWLIGYYAIEYSTRVSSIAILIGIASLFLIYSPLSLVYDPAFWLSFVATMSIILFYTPLSKKLWEYSIPTWISSIVALSIVASLGTIPISLYHFGSISLGVIFANILIASVVGWILFFSVWYMLLWFLWTSFLYIFGYLIYIPVVYIMYIAEFFGAWGSAEPIGTIKNIIILVFVAFFIFEILRDERIIVCPKVRKIHDSQ